MTLFSCDDTIYVVKIDGHGTSMYRKASDFCGPWFVVVNDGLESEFNRSFLDAVDVEKCGKHISFLFNGRAYNIKNTTTGVCFRESETGEWVTCSSVLKGGIHDVSFIKILKSSYNVFVI